MMKWLIGTPAWVRCSWSTGPMHFSQLEIYQLIDKGIGSRALLYTILLKEAGPPSQSFTKDYSFSYYLTFYEVSNIFLLI